MFTRSHSIETARRHHQANRHPVDESQQRLLQDWEGQNINVVHSPSSDEDTSLSFEARDVVPAPPHSNQATGVTPRSRARWLQAGRAIQAQSRMQQEAERVGVPHTHLPGSVQGIDLKRSPQEWAWLNARWADECCIMCVDFSPEKVSVNPNLHNDQLADLLAQPRPPWSNVRWINVDGLSWQVIQTLALHYELHPLAVEDVVHIPQRIKADFYEDFMYASLHLITLATAGLPNTGVQVVSAAKLETAPAASSPPPAPSPGMQTPFATHPHARDMPPAGNVLAPGAGKAPEVIDELRAEVVVGMEALQGGAGGAGSAGGRAAGGVDEEEDEVPTPHFKDSLNVLPGRRLGRTTSVTRAFGDTHMSRNHHNHHNHHARTSDKGKGAAKQHVAPPAPTQSKTQVQSQPASTAVNASTAASRTSSAGVPVHRQQVSIFLLNSNTIISIFETAGTALTRPLLQQLREPKTLARDAGDASYLLCLLLDALADSVYPVVDAYSCIIEGYEQRILADHPDASMTRELHLVQGDLATLRRTLLPTLHLVTGLRSHATEARGVFTTARGSQPATSPAATPATKQGPSEHAGGVPQPALQPLVTRLTKTYLGDVQDHLTSLMDALDSQTEGCRDLIDLAFNLIAHRTNQAMQALTVVSVFFLPLTFLAGIYGMNFDELPELHWTYGYAYFWGMCVAIVVLFVALSYRMGLLGFKERK